MNNETSETIQRWPGEISTLSGGTRTSITGLDRPWQKEMVIDRSICPFCREEQPGADRSYIVSVHDYKEAGAWKVRRNRMTPFPYHRLILPLECYESEETLWYLGGERKITGALYAAGDVMHSEDFPCEHVFFYVHVGYSAGQRWGHEHWHFVEPPTSPTLGKSDLDELADRKELVVFSDRGFTVVAGGCRAGQCYILPNDECSKMAFAAQMDILAANIHRLLGLFNRKFNSAQELKPDFEIFVRFSDGNLIYAKYIPILNMWGGSEYAAIDELTPFVLPWPHEATVRHLLS